MVVEELFDGSSLDRKMATMSVSKANENIVHVDLYLHSFNTLHKAGMLMYIYTSSVRCTKGAIATVFWGKKNHCRKRCC